MSSRQNCGAPRSCAPMLALSTLADAFVDERANLGRTRLVRPHCFVRVEPLEVHAAAEAALQLAAPLLAVGEPDGGSLFAVGYGLQLERDRHRLRDRRFACPDAPNLRIAPRPIGDHRGQRRPASIRARTKAGCHGGLAQALEVLHRALVPLRLQARLESAEVAALAGLGTYLPRVQAVLP